MAPSASSSAPIFLGFTLGKLSVRQPANDSRSGPVADAQLANDAKLAAICAAPLAPKKTAFGGYLNKELQLVAVMSQATIVDSRALHARLANPVGRDALAAKFMADVRRRGTLAGN